MNKHISIFLLALGILTSASAQQESENGDQENNLKAKNGLVSIEQKANLNPDTGLSTETRQAEASLLNKLLANEYVLYTKTLDFHWNVYGVLFGDLHRLFRKQYEQLLGNVDMIAERIRALGFRANGSLKKFSAEATLREEPGKVPQHLV